MCRREAGAEQQVESLMPVKNFTAELDNKLQLFERTGDIIILAVQHIENHGVMSHSMDVTLYYSCMTSCFRRKLKLGIAVTT
jgi:hypothetical protein